LEPVNNHLYTKCVPTLVALVLLRSVVAAAAVVS